LNKDAVYTDNNYNGEVSANRTTDDLKVFFRISGSKNKSTFTYEDAGVIQKIIIRNQNFNFWHYLIKSIDQHWSAAYEVNYNQNSFSNLKSQVQFRTAVEYDIFPYKQVNSHYFTINYGFTARNNHYYDTTLYNKLKETLWGHQAEATISFIQKWGSTSVGISYHNYFNDWKLFNFGAHLSTSVRITGGLSFYMFFSGALTRDQINLPKGGATEQEILTRRRQIASGYNIYSSFGLNYRFGSKVNNFVNPRFEGPSN
jgi:hypothetical protein